MIRRFRDDETRKIADGRRSRYFPPAIQSAAFRKLLNLDAAISLQVLAAIPGNRLEALKGDRRGQHSIRVNQQWRICFRWTAEGAADVEIVDYH